MWFKNCDGDWYFYGLDVQCLMTGLMFHRPDEHIQYLIECLEQVKTKGQDDLRWNMFIEMHHTKTPLPPITATNGHHSLSFSPKSVIYSLQNT